MKQEYQCEKCGLKSKVEFPPNLETLSACFMIEADHKSKSLDCNEFKEGFKVIRTEKKRIEIEKQNPALKLSGILV